MTKDQINAALRHAYTVFGTLVAFAVVVGLLGQEDADKIVRLVNEIGGGVAAIVGAVAALLPIINGARAAWSASNAQQNKKVESSPDVTVKPLTEQGIEMIGKALSK
jgi:hypothetical protein